MLPVPLAQGRLLPRRGGSLRSRGGEGRAEVDEDPSRWVWRADETEEENTRRYAAHVAIHGTEGGIPWEAGDPIPMF